MGSGAAPPCRLVRLNQRITRKDQPGLVYFNADQFRWIDGGWNEMTTAIVTGPSRLAVLWPALPTLPEWKAARKRVRLAAQLGAYVVAKLPEGYT